MLSAGRKPSVRGSYRSHKSQIQDTAGQRRKFCTSVSGHHLTGPLHSPTGKALVFAQNFKASIKIRKKKKMDVRQAQSEVWDRTPPSPGASLENRGHCSDDSVRPDGGETRLWPRSLVALDGFPFPSFEETAALSFIHHFYFCRGCDGSI